jgi:hypothetical protein
MAAGVGRIGGPTTHRLPDMGHLPNTLLRLATRPHSPRLHSHLRRDIDLPLHLPPDSWAPGVPDKKPACVVARDGKILATLPGGIRKTARFIRRKA